MGNPCKNGGLSSSLASKIVSIPKDSPWVWQLRLSNADFRELESHLINNRNNLISEDFALAVIVYLAEWYKRYYSSSTSVDALNLNSAELEAIWGLSGLNVDSFVYKDTQGHRRWLYSAYILGGLAMPLELSRGDNGRFLKALCRIFHHEDYTLENLVDEARAISFRESIQRHHSLYCYLQSILSGEMPFNQEELDDSSSLVHQFVLAVKFANDEVLRRKFRLEWIVVNAPGHNTMSRQLRLWLCPEEVNGGNHQYILYDRLRLWGVPAPDTVSHFDVGLRFLNGHEVVLNENFEEQLIRFVRTGDKETGFISFGVKSFVPVKNIPSGRFDHVEVLIRTDRGEVYKTQPSEEVGQFIQLWKEDPLYDRWTSRPNAQAATAVVFSGEWENTLASVQSEKKAFKCSDGTLSAPWSWAYIYDYIILRNRHNGKELTLYNRQGYDRIFTHLYTECIRYKEGGLVDYVAYDSDGEDISELLPLVFGVKDIRIRHFATKDDILNAAPESDTEPESVEWKTATGRYELWNEDSIPPFGALNLRLTVKGILKSFRAVYLPSMHPDLPVVRDYDRTSVFYADYDEGQNISLPSYQDRITRDGTPLNPAIAIEVGPEDAHVALDIWRPTLLKEICLDGKVISYHYNESIALPYVLKYEVVFRDFSRQGFREYECNNLANIYPMLGETSDSHKQEWQVGRIFASSTLDESAPASLSLCFGIQKPPVGSTIKFYHWDYLSEPTETDYRTETERNTIVFQSLEEIDNELTNVYPIINTYPFCWGKIRTQLSLVDCFEVAIRHRLHFFILQPFVNSAPEKFAVELYNGLMEKREGVLTEKDKIGLQRLSDEKGFSWDDYKISI